MNYDRKFLLWALGFAVFGLCVGIYMAASQNHGQLVAHAHIMLVGFVVSFIYAIIHKLWLVTPGRWVARIQFWLHIVCTVLLSIGLLLLYGQVYAAEWLEPVLSLGSVGVLLGMLLMGYMVLRSGSGRVSAT
ncbi:hypothetical protein [Oleiagrimonas soli]|uniref:Apolipoprotein N-acyltransferase n=1 Tax=Oleiagrimonas soli TaxID=1543381 RepID=A0A099CYP9_9GAMM|nr:hypothetical protein [Oleiagrimonas soli]KGI78806.1 TonB-dependent receptor [Oleiagrimonas soli]MBB6184417.1 apolipoprotein N-acyltransferase [Oleiagrimonas soli]